jgi:hypothetical protein
MPRLLSRLAALPQHMLWYLDFRTGGSAVRDIT